MFIPLLLMGGVVGRLFREFAINAVSGRSPISGVVSLTLTPMMCARLLRAEAEEAPPGALFRWTERGFERLLWGYEAGLNWVLRHQPVTLVFSVLTLVATVMLYGMVNKGFLPRLDTGLLIGITDAAQDISFPGDADARQNGGGGDRCARSGGGVGGQFRRRRFGQPNTEQRGGFTSTSARSDRHGPATR